MKREKYLFKNVVIFAIGSFGTKMISFFLIPFYTNILTTDQYGTIDLVYTICTVLVPVVTFNIAESVMRFALDKDADHNKIMSIGIAVLIFFTTIGILIIPVSKAFALIGDYGIYIYFYCVTLGYSQVALCYLRGNEQLVHYSIGNIIQTFSVAILNIVFLLGLHQGIQGYFKAYICANIITAIYACVVGRIRNVIKNFKIDFRLMREMIKYSFALIPNLFMWWIMNSSDRIMITSMIGAVANGIYSVAYKIPSLLSTGTIVFVQAWSYSAIQENDSEDKERYSNLVYDKMVCTVVLIAAGLLIIMKPFLKVYVSADYYVAWKYIPLLTIGYVFMTLGSFVATSYTVHKDSVGFLLSGTCGAVINLLLNWIFIPIMGAYGAAFATCISYFVVFAFRVVHTRKYLKLNVWNPIHLACIILLISMGVTAFWDSIQGKLLIVVEFLMISFILRKFVLKIFVLLKNKIQRK